MKLILAEVISVISVRVLPAVEVRFGELLVLPADILPQLPPEVGVAFYPAGRGPSTLLLAPAGERTNVPTGVYEWELRNLAGDLKKTRNWGSRCNGEWFMGLTEFEG